MCRVDLIQCAVQVVRNKSALLCCVVMCTRTTNNAFGDGRSRRVFVSLSACIQDLKWILHSWQKSTTFSTRLHLISDERIFRVPARERARLNGLTRNDTQHASRDQTSRKQNSQMEEREMQLLISCIKPSKRTTTMKGKEGRRFSNN